MLKTRPVMRREGAPSGKGYPNHADDRAGQPEDPPRARGGRQDLRLLQPARAAEEAGLSGISRLPVSMKVLLENLLRNEDGRPVGRDDLQGHRRLARQQGLRRARDQLPPGAGADAGLHRRAGGGRPGRHARRHDRSWAPTREKINPLNPVDLVIDHSVMVDYFGTAKAFGENVDARVRAQHASATASCAGAPRPSTTSASCRPAPASATR